MKTIQSKILLTLVIIFFIIGFSTSAKNLFHVNGFETSEIRDSVVRDMYLLENPKRVVYPDILKPHREESKDYVKSYSQRERSYIIHMLRKGQKYFDEAVKIFDQYGLPYEFQVLPALESNFSAHAVSPAGAVGYWQFMSTLAREYGLRVGGKYDERKNFTKSTHAAAKFFRDQLENYDGDILLAVASYNCGTGRVASSLKKSSKENPTYWDIKQYLPAETRRFVMKFISLNVIAENYDLFLARSLDFSEPRHLQIASNDTLLPVLPQYSFSGNTM